MWPSPSACCRRAPGPLAHHEILIRFADSGPQFAIQGDSFTDGFISSEEFEDPGDDLPLLPVNVPVGPSPRGGRARGRGRARAASADGFPIRGRGRGRAASVGVAAGGVGLPDASQALLAEIRGVIRTEVATLTDRVSSLEQAEGLVADCSGLIGAGGSPWSRPARWSSPWGWRRRVLRRPRGAASPWDGWQWRRLTSQSLRGSAFGAGIARCSRSGSPSGRNSSSSRTCSSTSGGCCRFAHCSAFGQRRSPRAYRERARGCSYSPNRGRAVILGRSFFTQRVPQPLGRSSRSR